MFTQVEPFQNTPPLRQKMEVHAGNNWKRKRWVMSKPRNIQFNTCFNPFTPGLYAHECWKFYLKVPGFGLGLGLIFAQIAVLADINIFSCDHHFFYNKISGGKWQRVETVKSNLGSKSFKLTARESRFWPKPAHRFLPPLFCNPHRSRDINPPQMGCQLKNELAASLNVVKHHSQILLFCTTFLSLYFGTYYLVHIHSILNRGSTNSNISNAKVMVDQCTSCCVTNWY